jgi:hypothetical protein
LNHLPRDQSAIFVFPMRKIAGFALLIFPLACPAATQLLPTEQGTAWPYQTTLETGDGVSFSHLKTDESGKVQLLSIYRIGGTKNIDGQDVLKFEMHRAGAVANTDLLIVDENGITCPARIGEDGKLAKLDPPQKVLVAPVTTGTKWNYDGKVGDLQVHQIYEIVAQENIAVVAGKFRAFRIHGEQTTPIPITLDRWFVPGVGFVKDVTTMRAPDGSLLQRVSLELKALPKTAPRPEARGADESSKKLSVALAKDPAGELTTKFPSTIPKIYARWQGRGLGDHARIRVVWIAENVEEIAPPDYKLDEASTIATAQDSHGIFTFAPPEDGFEPGDYRVQFYVDETLTETVKVKIVE